MTRTCVWKLDVWGNKDDGYWINDRIPIGEFSFPDQAGDAQIISMLKDEDVIPKHGRVELEDFYPDFDVIVNGKPVLTLEKIEEWA